MRIRKRKPLSDRFWAKVDKRGPDECWPWTAHAVKGYGRINRGGREGPVLATRVSWELHNGPISDGLNALHRCDNPACVNPNHLFLGTQKDNVADMCAKGRARGGTRGEQNGNSKLTADQVRAIRMANEPRRFVIEKFRISKSQYWNIKTGQQWAGLR